MIKQLTLCAALIAAAAPALAHPGHADQSIHLAEWLMGVGLLAGSIVPLRGLRRRARHECQQRHVDIKAGPH